MGKESKLAEPASRPVVDRSDLPQLDALRVICCVFVLSHHVLLLAGLFVSEQDVPELHRFYDSTLGRWMECGHFGVDGMFLMSGFLLLRSLLSQHPKNSTWQTVCRLLYRRLFRLFPMQIVTALEAAPLNPKCPCLEETLFAITPLYDLAARACIPFTWSNSADVQMWLLVLPLLLFSQRHPGSKLFSHMVWMLLASQIARGISFWAHDFPYPPAYLAFRDLMFQQDKDILETALNATLPFSSATQHNPVLAAYQRNIYFFSLTRIGSFIVGVICSLIYHFRPRLLSKIHARGNILALAAFAAIASVVELSSPQRRWGFALPPPALFAYHTVAHVTVAGACGAILLLALAPPERAAGEAGSVVERRGPAAVALSTALGASFWKPLAKVSFSTYMTHFGIVAVSLRAFLAGDGVSVPSGALAGCLMRGLLPAMAGGFLSGAIHYFLVERPGVLLGSWLWPSPTRHVAERKE